MASGCFLLSYLSIWALMQLEDSNTNTVSWVSSYWKFPEEEVTQEDESSGNMDFNSFSVSTVCMCTCIHAKRASEWQKII